MTEEQFEALIEHIDSMIKVRVKQHPTAKFYPNRLLEKREKLKDVMVDRFDIKGEVEVTFDSIVAEVATDRLGMVHFTSDDITREQPDERTIYDRFVRDHLDRLEKEVKQNEAALKGFGNVEAGVGFGDAEIDTDTATVTFPGGDPKVSTEDGVSSDRVGWYVESLLNQLDGILSGKAIPEPVIVATQIEVEGDEKCPFEVGDRLYGPKNKEMYDKWWEGLAYNQRYASPEKKGEGSRKGPIKGYGYGPDNDEDMMEEE